MIHPKLIKSYIISQYKNIFLQNHTSLLDLWEYLTNVSCFQGWTNGIKRQLTFLSNREEWHCQHTEVKSIIFWWRKRTLILLAICMNCIKLDRRPTKGQAFQMKAWKSLRRRSTRLKRYFLQFWRTHFNWIISGKNTKSRYSHYLSTRKRFSPKESWKFCIEKLFQQIQKWVLSSLLEWIYVFFIIEYNILFPLWLCYGVMTCYSSFAILRLLILMSNHLIFDTGSHSFGCKWRRKSINIWSTSKKHSLQY